VSLVYSLGKLGCSTALILNGNQTVIAASHKPHASGLHCLLKLCSPLLLQDALDKLAPEGDHYRHLDEGYDDMPAHVKVSNML
jgi:thiamine phosphate synthase YjbQ (UPF0047 family)